MVFIPLGYIPRSGIARVNGMSSFNFMEVEILIPQKTKQFIFSPSIYETIPLPMSLPAINLKALFKFYASLMRVKSFLIVDLIFISMTTSEFEHLVLFLLTIWT